MAHAQAQVRHDCERREAGSWPLKWLLAAAAVTAGSLITLLELCRRAGLHSQRQLGAKRMLDEIERDTEGLEAEPPARHVADTSLPEGEAQPTVLHEWLGKCEQQLLTTAPQAPVDGSR